MKRGLILQGWSETPFWWITSPIMCKGKKQRMWKWCWQWRIRYSVIQTKCWLLPQVTVTEDTVGFQSRLVHCLACRCSLSHCYCSSEGVVNAIGKEVLEHRYDSLRLRTNTQTKRNHWWKEIVSRQQIPSFEWQGFYRHQQKWSVQCVPEIWKEGDNSEGM